MDRRRDTRNGGMPFGCAVTLFLAALAIIVALAKAGEGLNLPGW